MARTQKKSPILKPSWSTLALFAGATLTACAPGQHSTLKNHPSPAIRSNVQANTPLPISVSQTSILDELSDSPERFPQIDHETLLRRLNEGDVISIGESHEHGVERAYIAQLYTDLAASLQPKPVSCLVEDYNLLIPKTKDPVHTSFVSVCPESQIYSNKGSMYAKHIAAGLKKGRVLTHTGYRHTLPWALIYTQDYPSPQWVDIPPHGTLTKQLPDSFASDGKQMRTEVTQSFDSLVLYRVGTDMISQLTQQTFASQFGATEATRIEHWAASPALTFQKGEPARIFEVSRVHESFPYEHAYLSLIHHDGFQPELLAELLRSPEFAQFATLVTPKSIQLEAFLPADPVHDSGYQIGTVLVNEPGTFFVYGPAASHQNKDVVLKINTKHQIQLLFSDL
jgi:hypothetical protein